MTKLKDFSELQQLKNNSVNYSNQNSEYQTRGKKAPGLHYEKDPYSKYQNFLYKRALFGLNIYDEDELKTMHIGKKKRIKKVNYRCQVIINLMKQEKVNSICNTLGKFFKSKSTAAKLAFSDMFNITDPDYFNQMDVKDLGLKKDDIIDRLIKEKVLPYNFLEL